LHLRILNARFRAKYFDNIILEIAPDFKQKHPFERFSSLKLSAGLIFTAFTIKS